MSDVLPLSLSLVENGSVGPVVFTPDRPITTRLATLDDIPFMDALQKQYNKQLGFFPTAQLEGYVNGQWVIIAHDPATGERLGFCASRDRYLKRDELGVIYLLCVVPGVQRKLVGASLIKAVFERSAYGCRLYCCWCAQDIAANHFWESLGFVPIAFRAGSTGKKRVHIFWQRRIDDGDESTKYWYPFQTNSGAIRQDRLVFPIPSGVHWKDVRAISVPTIGEDGTPALDVNQPKQLRSPKPKTPPVPKQLNVAPTGKIGIFVGGKLRFVDRPGYVVPTPEPVKKSRRAKSEKLPAPKFDPKYLAAARELRDRYLEQMNREGVALPTAKHDVSRHIGETFTVDQVDPKQITSREMHLLSAA